jgi:anaerobic ribonucleoside-triphosphate reductase activating protein
LVCFQGGSDFRSFVQDIEKYITSYGNLIQNIFLLGGSFNHQKLGDLEEFFDIVHPIIKDKKVWLFAREDLKDIQQIFIDYCDYIKVGAYIPELSCIGNISHGVELATSNQKVLKKGLDY